jgi:3-oxoacyl-[acyl-carrier-protein] synthase-1
MTTGLDIVATAARTPVGLVAETSAAAVRAGISRLREFPYVTPQGQPLLVAADPKLDDALEGRARLEPLLASVVAEVRAKLGGIDLSKGGCDVFLALPEERPGFSAADAEWLTHRATELLRAKQVGARVLVGGRGHAGVLAAVERAVTLARERREALIYLVIGVDSYIHLRTFAWLEQRRQLAQPEIRNGFVPGEAAGALVLVASPMRRQLGLPSLASVAGVATARETRLRDSETGSFGVATSQAVLLAAAKLPLPAEAADAVLCDINGERYRSEDWAFFAMRTHQAVRRLEYQAPSDSWGDVGAAFGALAGVLAVQSFARRYAPGPRALLMAGSESGLRGAMFLQAPDAG